MADHCILWDKCKNKDGYGRLGRSINGQKKYYRAHRYFYELQFGKIPPGKVLDHLCKNRGCVNVNHLEVVSQQENVVRGNSTNLDRQKVNSIRQLYKLKQMKQKELGTLFGVRQDTISRIVNFERWI